MTRRQGAFPLLLLTGVSLRTRGDLWGEMASARDDAAGVQSREARCMMGDPTGYPGQRIGLLGGSFDPPHEGHAHITRWALRRFRLHQVWWLVSPANPLKTRSPAPLERRMETCRVVMPARTIATDIERRLGTRYTADTLRGLCKTYPGVRFVWLMGADNLTGFHEWRDWQWIMETVPIGVMARPGHQVKAALSPAARRYRRWRLPRAQAGGLASRRAPAWTLLTGAMSSASSTALRAKGVW